MMGSATYPRRVDPQDAFDQRTLDKLTSHLISWRQGPGNIGGLHLHACWGETGVLAERYQGQTTAMAYWLMQGAMKLYDRTGAPWWRLFADEVVSNVLFLQADDGGFIHARSEFEPGYTSGRSCPIHQCLPVIALLDYAGWTHADPKFARPIREAADRHWQHMQTFYWKNGNDWRRRPLPVPAWCGVANQDLTMIAVLAKYANLYGDDGRFGRVGLDSLNYYLGSDVYFPEIGLMERGDRPNFVERTGYYEIILTMFEMIDDMTGDSRLADARRNIVDHLFDAVFTGSDGLAHLSWGADTLAGERSRIAGWIRYPVTLQTYPGLIEHMRKDLAERPDTHKAAIVESLEKTLAAYVFADGTIPGAVGAESELFAVVTTPPGQLSFWTFLINRLGERLQAPKVEPLPVIHRTYGDLAWTSGPQFWEMSKAGSRLFAGWKINPHGIVHGPQEELKDADFGELAESDFVERILPIT